MKRKIASKKKAIAGQTTPRNKAKRTKRIVFTLNDMENEALASYCQKYKINNRSGLIRHVLMSSILKRFDEDYPTLF